MKKDFIIILSLAFCIMYPSANVLAVEVAPRISDREIIENLANIRGDIKELKAEIKRLDEGQIAIQQQINGLKESTNKWLDDINKRFDDMNNSVNKRFDDMNNSVNKRFDDLQESTNRRFDDINGRFDILQWMFGLFITVALSLMGIMGRILWNQQKKLTQIETSLEAQKEELSFLKSLIEKLQSLIEKLLPPRGVL
jgi:septal ring factor EnvC (AmiA/AmiB activator)